MRLLLDELGNRREVVVVPNDGSPGPGDLPRSGGLLPESPFCSNMARRFLTPDMFAVCRCKCRLGVEVVGNVRSSTDQGGRWKV